MLYRQEPFARIRSLLSTAARIDQSLLIPLDACEYRTELKGADIRTPCR